MKKLLRWILIFLVFALMAALSAITALACSPDDNNPEHHENVIQTEEKKPTCLEGGYSVLECTVCRWSCAFSIGDIVPHEFGPWEIVPGKEPTCTKAGEKRAYCSTCNKWYPELAPATGHSWYKYYTKEPTCTTAGEYYTYCRNCPASQGRSTEPATGHFWVVWKRVFATCTTPGYTEFVCDDCGADGGDHHDARQGAQLRRVVYHDAGHLHGGRHAEAGVRNLRCDGEPRDPQDGT